ncbi:MAG: RNA polymerase subunit sigma-24 [Flavobacterium sp. MedPE-SWcel]|uniref:RNA polymerase sigma factor n=1 Tax=uncultured Flavobacterium sp. TaxID=165435 RepID=UPI0009220751|nr:RNA polymerase sigma factor [uncultured Flavobacterium sp.]OIQ16904.1 MAG: RNA polymerase subunit sigma-24 [Flavobacterium sp. MedPE-SWcel]
MADHDDLFYINKVCSGDTASYTVLVDRYKNMAYTLALKIMKNEDDAEDSAQEAFIKAFKQLHSFKKESKFSTWLYTIVYRTAIYNIRGKKKNIERITETNSKHHNESSILENIEKKEQQLLVHQAIDSLPETEALIVTLFYINEATIAEIETITGLSESNIKVKLFRARKKLKQKLQVTLQAELN